VLVDALTAVVSAIKLQTAPRLALLPVITVVRKATFRVIAVPLRRQSRATSVAKKAIFPATALTLLHPEVEAEAEDGEPAAVAADRPALSAISAERSGTSPVHALRLPLEEEEEATARSAVVVVVDLKRLATPAVV